MFMVHPVVSSVSQQLTNNQNKYVNSDHVGAVLIIDITSNPTLFIMKLVTCLLIITLVRSQGNL